MNTFVETRMKGRPFFSSLPIVNLETAPNQFRQLPTHGFSSIDWSMENFDDIVAWDESEADSRQVAIANHSYARVPLLRRSALRIGMLVNHASATEGVIEKLFELCSDEFNRWAGLRHDPKLAIGEMKDAFREVRVSRNKIYAHTAFASPRRDDSPAFQRGTLETFSGALLPFDEAGNVHIGGERTLDDDPPTAAALPKWSVKMLATFYTAHVGRWHQHFADMLAPLATFSRMDIERFSPGVMRINMNGRLL